MLDSGGFWISKTPGVHSADWETAWIRTAGHQESADAFTFHNFEGEQYSAERHGYPSSRIDWILIRNSLWEMQINSCEIIRDNKHPLYPSDHYPVLAELMLK
jgi:exonuclease III